MHKLVHFQQARPAYMLMDFLLTQGIECIVQEDEQDGSFWLAVQHDSDIEKAQTHIRAFIEHPSDPKYQAASWDNPSPSTPKSQVRPKRRKTDWGQHDLVQTARDNWWTSGILLFNVLIFLVYNIFPSMSLWVGAHFFIAPLAELSTTHEWWRLVTPAFLHFSALHIIFNLLWWWILGTMIEKQLGKLMLIAIFLITAIGAHVTQLLATGPNFGGMSGVVYGLFGFVWFIGWLRPQWGMYLQPQLIGFMLVWLLIGFVDVLFVSMANEAYLSGLIIGCLLALLLHQLSNKLPTK
ncbi:MAG: rhomboid family intramembrane serine protease GlpG [Glaciecola sp.]|jgi:GlpG protein